GTLELLSQDERNRVQGIIVNTYRGDLSMFTDGVRWIEEKTGVPVLGVIPFFTHQFDAEDSLSKDISTRLTTSVTSDMYSYTEDEHNEEVARHVKKHLDWVQVKDIIHRWNQL